MKQYSLNDLHTFIAVVENHSFYQAAERLQTSAASVSRRVSHLEAALGVRLLNRTTRQLHLTEAGQQFYGDIQALLGGLQEAEERIGSGTNALTGCLKIATPMSFGIQVIAPLLTNFMQMHPQINLDLQLEDQQTDLLADGIDLAIRIGQLQDSTLIATRLGEIEFGYYAAPKYLDQYGEPNTLEELAQHQCLHYRHISRTQEWGMQERSVNLQGRLSANNGEVLCEAAIQGLGIVSLPRFIVEKALAQQQLRPILCDDLCNDLYDNAPATLGLYALRLSRQFTPEKVRVFIDYLRENLKSGL